MIRASTFPSITQTTPTAPSPAASRWARRSPRNWSAAMSTRQSCTTIASGRWSTPCPRSTSTRWNWSASGRSTTASSRWASSSSPTAISMACRASAESRASQFEPRMMDGKHHIEILKDLAGSQHDLVVIGALGIGRARDSVIGSVCERVARQSDRDVWVVKHVPEPGEAERDTILVGIDGSPQSFGALMTAIDLARTFGKKVEAIAVLRPLSALLRLQRHRQRPHRAGGEGLPLRGAESAPRGDHRHRARADLSVSSRGGRADGERGRRRDQEDAPRRQALPEDHRPRAQDESVAHRAGADRRPQPEGRDGAGEQRGEHSPRARPAMSSSPRASRCRASTCAPRRPSDGRPKPRSG